MIRLTLITIVRNDKDGLKYTYQSLKNKPSWVKWVVIDGASTDGTADYIKNISNDIDFWISEPDCGIADAFNKGILSSQTDFVLFLNAGDTLLEGFYTSTKQILQELKISNTSIGVGRIKFGSRVVGRPVSSNMQRRRNYLPHQSMLIKLKAFKEFGLYDTDYKLGMDYEWSLRLLDNWTENLVFYDDILVRMDNNGISVNSYPKTFYSYHIARLKNKTLSNMSSLTYCAFFIFKRTISISVKFLSNAIRNN